MSKALEIWRSLSAAMGKVGSAPPAMWMSDFHFTWSSTPSHRDAQHLHAALLPFLVKLRDGAELGGADGGEVLGDARKRTAQPSPTQSCRSIGPWSVSTWRFGIVSLMRKAMSWLPWFMSAPDLGRAPAK
jgi:hypothetical protein